MRNMAVRVAVNGGNRVRVEVSVGGLNDGGNAGIGERHGDRSHAERLAIPGAGEDHVLHAGAAKGFRRLLAKDPAYGVAQIRFSTAIRPHDGGDARSVKAHLAFVKERLEALNLDSPEFQQSTCSSLGSTFSGDVFYRKRVWPKSKAVGLRYFVAITMLPQHMLSRAGLKKL